MKDLSVIFTTLALLMIASYFIRSKVDADEFKKFTIDCQNHGGEIVEFPAKHYLCWNNETKTEVEW